MRLIITMLIWTGLFSPPAPTSASGSTDAAGVLLLAHGGSEEWNARVRDVVREVDSSYPTEVAFGMASRPSIVAALDRLKARGASRIVAVPLFVSSHSSVVTSTEYLLGLRPSAPADLAIFAKMAHGPHQGSAATHADGHAESPAADPVSPIAVGLPIAITPAFNQHPLVGAILADRALAISEKPTSEAVVIVAHGPGDDHDNDRWLSDMTVLAESVRGAAPFAAVNALTVRDDAEPAVRDAATRELRAVVSAHVAAGRRVLVVPHLMSYGGIEGGIRRRLDGLEYTMAARALLPDARIAEWVRASAASASRR